MKIADHPTQRLQKPGTQAEISSREITAQSGGLSIAVPNEGADCGVPTNPQLGTILVKAGLITEQQLHEALNTQQEQDNYKPLGQILVDQKILSPKQLNMLLDKSQKRAKLGEILLKSKAITGE